MTAKIIDGKQIAADLRASTKEEVEKFVALYGKKPTLAVVLVGEDPASQVYVNTKTKMKYLCLMVGPSHQVHQLDLLIIQFMMFG